MNVKNVLINQYMKLRRRLRMLSSNRIFYRRSHNVENVSYNVVKNMLKNIMIKYGFVVLREINNRIEFCIDYNRFVVVFTIGDCSNFPRLAVSRTRTNFEIRCAFTHRDIVYRDILCLSARCEGYRGAIWSLSEKELNSRIMDVIRNVPAIYLINNSFVEV